MDDMDMIQDLVLARQEAAVAALRAEAARDRAVPPPLRRECAECGCDIPAARLARVPTAFLCVDCASEREARARRR